MIRDQISGFRGLDHDPDFRWRGTNVTRIENLSDIAFALALGMIISSANAPRSFAELQEFLYFLIPTAAAFAVMLQVWVTHYTFFRRYGVADRFIIGLNACLIFVVLYLAYPLLFTFSALYAWIVGQFTGDYSRALEMGMTTQNSVMTICFFVFAYALCQAIMAIMYAYVVRRRALLKLNAHELDITVVTLIGLIWSTVIACLAIPVALLTPFGPFAAFLLFFQSIGYSVARRVISRRRAAQAHTET